MIWHGCCLSPIILKCVYRICSTGGFCMQLHHPASSLLGNYEVIKACLFSCGNLNSLYSYESHDRNVCRHRAFSGSGPNLSLSLFPHRTWHMGRTRRPTASIVTANSASLWTAPDSSSSSLILESRQAWAIFTRIHPFFAPH